MNARTGEIAPDTERLRAPGADGPVVVGVDGMPRSVGALRWAADEALHRGVGLVAVHACEPAGPIAPYAPVPERGPDLDRETEHLADLVRLALGDEPRVPVRQVCEPTTATRALLARGRGASLLVLATSADIATGVGIGATALACVRHPPCPVVLLPDRTWP